MLKNFENLHIHGYQFFESISSSDRRYFLSLIKLNEVSKTYTSNSKIGNKIIKRLNIDIDKLNEAYEHLYKEKPPLNSTYFVLRVMKPGEVSEGYRSHFDSHRFTFVIPIKIPEKSKGNLYFIPKLRNEPKNFITNIITKIFWKFFSGKAGFKILQYFKKIHQEDFKKYKPMLFLGRTTFHGNFPVDAFSNEERITFLLHFFDPEPIGIGNIMRGLRKR